MPNPTLSCTATAPAPKWIDFEVACRMRQLKNIGGGNKQQNRATLLAMVKAEIATNGLASTWTRAHTLNPNVRFKVIVEKVPGAHAA